MGEVDRLSNSGLYPALPIADKRRDKNDSPGQQRPETHDDAGHGPEPGAPRPPKSIIDEYA